MLKRSSGGSNWAILDTMRGLNANKGSSPPSRLEANLTNAENTVGLNGAYIDSEGFYPWGNGGGDWNASSGEYIYCAIRSPQKTPVNSREVFAIDNRDADYPSFDSDFSVDMAIMKRTT